MKAAFAPLGFALGASAAALVPRDQCCFSLTASGGVSGTVGQLGDGQNRIAQTGGLDKQSGQYCIDNGKITDGNGRGCILTPPTTQFQCDVGASPTGGFSVSNGNLAHDGNSQFYACPTGDNGGYNIYTKAVENQQGCVTVTLSTGGKCSSGGSSSSAPASSAPASSAPASSAPAFSKPASSAPASSKPVSSAPASSAPAPSAPASSAPAPSAPAPSAPASSAPPAGPKTETVFSTHYQTVTSCAASVTNCPAQSTVTKSTVVQTSSAPAPSAPAPAPSSSAPASSAPAPSSSKPASSAPAPSSSAPASSAPAPAPSSSAPASSAPAPSSTKPTSASGSACPTSLTGAYQTPHAIIPINSNAPDKSYGTQYFAYLGGGNSTIFNFDIPQDYSGKQCSVIFLFPKQKDLETSSFTESGSGSLTFSTLTSPAGLDVSLTSAPKIASQIGQINNVAPGNSYLVSTGACAAGTTQSIEVSATHGYKLSATHGYKLSFFQDWNPSPIGLFLTSC